jgi:hypothetical protein
MTFDTSAFRANISGHTGKNLELLMLWNKIVDHPSMITFFQYEINRFKIIDNVFKRTEEAANGVADEIRLPGNYLKKEDMIISTMRVNKFAEEKKGCVYVHKHTLEDRNGKLEPKRDEESSSLWGPNRATHFCTTEATRMTEEDKCQGVTARRFLKDELTCLNPNGSEEGDVIVEDYGNIGYYYFPLGGRDEISKIRGDGHAYHLEMWGHLISRGYFFYKKVPHQSLSRNYNFAIIDPTGNINRMHGVGLIVVLPDTCATVALNEEYFSECHHYQRNDNKPHFPPSIGRVELASIRDKGYNETRNPESVNLTISHRERWKDMFGKLVKYMKRTGFDKDSGKTFVVFYDNHETHHEAEEDGAQYLEMWWKIQIGYGNHSRMISPNERRELEDVGVCFDIRKVQAELDARARNRVSNNTAIMLSKMKKTRKRKRGKSSSAHHE